ncbi:MAG: ATP-binding cassette domain-containing protein [Cyanobacteria bacterium HKST-UBA03]|nr:ATP-binding cassette domain-containing protein [Cyanobacteria bacterium HKST-UBA03]
MCAALPQATPNNPQHDTADALLSVRNLTKHFPVKKGFFNKTVGHVHAVNDLSFDIRPGEILGIVGESGCGKSTLARCILQLLRPTSGQVLFDGHELTRLSQNELRPLRQDMQIIFQNPYSSLDPRMSIGDTIAEPFIIHKTKRGPQRTAAVRELLNLVGLAQSSFDRFPHELSGGQRQRVGIARALALRPKFVVADEPVSALDVSVQAQILNLLIELKDSFNLTYLFIAHNLSVVDYLCDRIGVMYLGHLMELGPAHQVYDTPLHPYSQSLINAVPKTDPRHRHQHRILLEGDLPSPINPPTGCVFHTRCPHTQDNCKTEDPQLRVPDHHGPNRWVACPHAEAIQQSLKKGP